MFTPIHYKPSRVYRDVMGYDFQGGTLLNRNNFESLFPFIYFKLPNIKEDKVKLSFHYELRGEPNADYTIYAIVLQKEENYFLYTY